jgi:uncharacterized membrane protein YqaE (UPF0057 family)
MLFLQSPACVSQWSSYGFLAYYFYNYSSPLGVLIGKGFGWAFILNVILTLLGYFPGLIHAFWVQLRD